MMQSKAPQSGDDSYALVGPVTDQADRIEIWHYLGFLEFWLAYPPAYAILGGEGVTSSAPLLLTPLAPCRKSLARDCS